MENKEIVIKELTDLVKFNPNHTSLVNAVIATLGDKWNSEGMEAQTGTICPQGYHKDANGVCVPDVGP